MNCSSGTWRLQVSSSCITASQLEEEEIFHQGHLSRLGVWGVKPAVWVSPNNISPLTVQFLMAVQTGRHSKERDGAWRESCRRKLVSKELVKVGASCVVVPMHVHNRASCLTGIMYFCCVPHALLSASNSHKWLYKSTLKESFVITVDADLPESTKMNISWSGPRNSKWCTRIEKYFNVWLALDFFFSFVSSWQNCSTGIFFSVFILLLNPCWVTRNIVVVYLSCCSFQLQITYTIIQAIDWVFL